MNFVELPKDAPANVLVANGAMVHVGREEHPESASIIEEVFQEMQRIPVTNKELARVDGSLTCCSVLINIRS